MPARTALVLSGGGLFGAWQAGAWSVVRERFAPDLVVGASIGALNGYLIASGASAEDLRGRWLDPSLARIGTLGATLRGLTTRYQPRIPLAVAVTDMFRLKPRVFCGSEITWKHLAASCALPLVLPPRRIGGRWYVDGGLLNSLPLWAAVESGAARIVALHALPEIPSFALRVLAKAFRALAGYDPPRSSSIEVEMLVPSQRLGGVRDSLLWKRANVERWWELGVSDARGLSCYHRQVGGA
jgi:NTE family protein